MEIRSKPVLGPDKAYGHIAFNNRRKLYCIEALVDSPTVTVLEFAALWRGKGFNVYQRLHADGESGQFNIVEPMTNGYVVRVWP
jgi:hypothetical protein